jgi:dihydroorotase
MRASTWTPAQLIKHPEIGHLTVGAPADIAVWNVLSGKFGYADAAGGRMEGNQRLLCELTIRDGRIAFDYNARGAQNDFRKMPPTYGIRPGIDEIIRPK